MSDLKLYRILETFDELESARDKLTPVKEADINEEEVDETQTKVQTMGSKVKVTTDGDTTEFDDAETAKAFMGDDENEFATESEELEEGGLGADAWDAAADELDMMDIDDNLALPEIPADEFGLEAAAEFGEWEPEMEEGADNIEKYGIEDSSPFGDLHGNYDSHEEGAEFATFDSENEAHRKRLQRGTPVVLSPELFSDENVNRRGVFVNRSPSGHFGTVVRDVDGKEVKVHLSDIKSADLVNNSIYEEFDLNFEELLAEDITMTQTTNLENPENDTTTVTAIGPDAADELSAMMANAGLATGEYASMDAPPIDAGEVDTGAPTELPMQGMIDVMDQPEVEEGYGRNMYAADDDEYPGAGANLSIDDETDVEPSDADLDQIEVDSEFDLEFDESQGMVSEDDIQHLSPETAKRINDGLDLYEILADGTDVSPKDKEILQRAYDEISQEGHLHPDDDFELIYDRMYSKIHDMFGEDELVVDEERDIEHANTPNELEAGVEMVTHGTSGGLNKPKRMFKPAAGGDNAMQRPMESLDEMFEAEMVDEEVVDEEVVDEEVVDEAPKAKKPWEKEEVDEADDNTLVNEHENVDSFLDLYKEFTVRTNKK